jgi:hypothetical protein
MPESSRVSWKRPQGFQEFIGLWMVTTTMRCRKRRMFSPSRPERRAALILGCASRTARPLSRTVGAPASGRKRQHPLITPAAVLRLNDAVDVARCLRPGHSHDPPWTSPSRHEGSIGVRGSCSDADALLRGPRASSASAPQVPRDPRSAVSDAASACASPPAPRPSSGYRPRATGQRCASNGRFRRNCDGRTNSASDGCRRKRPVTASQCHRPVSHARGLRPRRVGRCASHRFDRCQEVDRAGARGLEERQISCITPPVRVAQDRPEALGTDPVH